MQIKYLHSQYKKKVWCSPLEIVPLLLALIVKMVEYYVWKLENYLPNSLVDKEERVGSSSLLTNNPMIVATSRSIRLIVAKGKMMLFMEVA